jgi:flagellar motor switch protein FliM
MTSPASPAQTRSYIVERLIGASGATEQVISVARGLGERALPGFIKSFNDQLSTAVEIEIREVEIGRQGDMLDIAGPHDALTVVASASSGDALVLVIDTGAIGVVLNALFGGDPTAASPIERELSAIELDVAALAFDQIAKAVNGTGTRSFNLKFPLAPPITGAELRKKILRDGPSVRIKFSIFTSAAAGTLTLSMPQRVLLQYRGGMATAREKAATTEPDWTERFSKGLMKTAAVLEATIPMGRMTLADLTALKEGQVLEMPAAAPSQTRLCARNKTLFVGEFGKLGQHYTIRIRHPFDAGQDLMDGILPPGMAERRLGDIEA